MRKKGTEYVYTQQLFVPSVVWWRGGERRSCLPRRSCGRRDASAMSSIVEKIKDIEKEISRTQVNKATMSHLCILRAKLAKYRTELLAPPKTGAPGAGEGFDVEKVGDARVALIGFPSVGKSTILSTFTTTKSEAASYEFTTLTCIPGIIHHKDCRIQLLDLPGIIEGASEGKGRGRQVIAVARSCDLILIVVDAGSGKADRQRELLERELDVVGLRLNQRPPNVYFKRKNTGGVSVSATCQLVNITEQDVSQLLHEYRIHSAEVQQALGRGGGGKGGEGGEGGEWGGVGGPCMPVAMRAGGIASCGVPAPHAQLSGPRPSLALALSRSSSSLSVRAVLFRVDAVLCRALPCCVCCVCCGGWYGG